MSETASAQKRTRLAMMLPGAVSLGAYEGGALAAVLTAVQAADDELVVDAISSASAGSLTALIASRALLCGADPVKLMTATWVDLPSLDELATHDLAAPLTMDRLAAAAKDLLGDQRIPDGEFRRQDCAVSFSMSLTVLGGLTYKMSRLRDPQSASPNETMLAQTAVDWFGGTLEPGCGQDAFLAVVDWALASGATPVGFPPRLLVYDKTEKDAHEAAGIVHPDGASWAVWYSDGGDLDNEPFGRLLDLIGGIETPEDDDRAIVVLQMEPAVTSWSGEWFDPDASHVPSWIHTLLRVSHLRQSQNYYDDLRQLEKTNSHLRWIELLASHLNQGLEQATGRLSAADRKLVIDGVTSALQAAADAIAREQQGIRHDIGVEEPTAAVPVPDITLQSVLEEAAGLHGKAPVRVEVISPDIDPTDHRPAAQQLAGEFLFHFGGFFDVKFRQSDFALGYRNAMAWLEPWLKGRVSHPDVVLDAVKQGYARLGWVPDEGDASIGKLSWREDHQAIKLAGHILHVVAHELT